MAKLHFRYGTMGSSKTANALMTRYNYIERGKNALLLKPRMDTRDGETVIRSRIGLEAECEFTESYITPLLMRCVRYGDDKTEDTEKVEQTIKKIKALSIIIVDEAQFLTRLQVDMLASIVDNFNVPVICYGLRTDFQGNFFEGSKRLMEIADVIEEIPTICWCGKKAQFNARIKDGQIIKSGKQLVLGGNDSYVALCRKHYALGKLSD